MNFAKIKYNTLNKVCFGNTEKCHAADTGYDTEPCHSIQTWGQPAVVLSIDVERHTGIHNYSFECLSSDPIGEINQKKKNRHPPSTVL